MKIANKRLGTASQKHDQTVLLSFKIVGSGFGSVGRAIISNSRDPRFKSGHSQINICTVNCYKDKSKMKRGLGGSPGLVVMGVDSCSRGRGFESRRHTLDGHDIFHIDVL